ncbi:hypothetical protein [Campylobacter sp.]|uniref:hypothetical protein n=1 Tax=Campylobacter sp. TaxID=205 RepID=UPI002A808DAF|nr:hypothetical protein [Campylobacter sp.]MCI7237965.1 hypothetical protein [Campylobacter sp.]MDY4803540.1 hypothetical protein [Campylobacter sp.]MDY4830005.1 hypothetical protein [Campylobacter sp.]
MILHWDGSSPLLMVLLMIVFYMWAKVDKRKREKEISSLYTINDDKPTKEYKQINFNDKKDEFLKDYLSSYNYKKY